MKRVDFDKLQIDNGDYRIYYRSNWYGARIRNMIGTVFIKKDDYILDTIFWRRISYRSIVSVEKINREINK